MSDVLKDLVRDIARASCDAVTRRAIRAMQRVRHTLSGDNSPLKTAWDEVCVQVQSGEESFFWDAYLDTLRGFVHGYVEQLPDWEKRAMWLQTEAGWDWLWDAEHADAESTAAAHKATAQGVPYGLDEIVEIIVQEYVLPRAESWSNARIQRYIERSYEED